MATYRFRCSSCGLDHEENYRIGTARRITKCECGRPARLVIGEDVYISASATPNRSPNVVALHARDRRFDKDGPAYLRMRNRGLQPEHIDGCAQLEDRVGTQDDIDYARAIKVAETVGGGKERVLEAVSTLEVTHG